MSALRSRVLRLKDALWPRPDPTVELVPATDLAAGDRFRFVGSWFEVAQLAQFGDRVEVRATDGDGLLRVDFVPHEAVPVLLPRPTRRLPR